ncbi:OLC1v1028081C1 [Oldenlandia corymbosa var. corymbosa]|uniref:OLC1v1028081C1 n=1 Tax=Oldenlandia corymbosa var. corymbosa TaxID=529605 RepID=A0AAV1CAX9_OLDCO|nr:OLC1v1028081C1 [Oldenlandia corymbosa var. corymbosa]
MQLTLPRTLAAVGKIRRWARLEDRKPGTIRVGNPERRPGKRDWPGGDGRGRTLGRTVVLGRPGWQWREFGRGKEQRSGIGVIVKDGKGNVIDGNDGMWVGTADLEGWMATAGIGRERIGKFGIERKKKKKKKKRAAAMDEYEDDDNIMKPNQKLTEESTSHGEEEEEEEERGQCVTVGGEGLLSRKKGERERSESVT